MSTVFPVAAALIQVVSLIERFPMSSKLKQNKTVKINSEKKDSGVGRGKMTEAQRKKNRRFMILSIAAIITGLFMSISQSLNNEYAAAYAWQETARKEVSVLKTAAEDLLASEKAEAILESDAVKSLKDAAERISDDAGMAELNTAVLDIKEAVSLLPDAAEKGKTDLTSEIRAVSEAAEKAESSLEAANVQAKAFNEKREMFYNKPFALTMGLSEIETF